MVLVCIRAQLFNRLHNWSVHLLHAWRGLGVLLAVIAKRKEDVCLCDLGAGIAALDTGQIIWHWMARGRCTIDALPETKSRSNAQVGVFGGCRQFFMTAVVPYDACELAHRVGSRPAWGRYRGDDCWMISELTGIFDRSCLL